MRELKVQAYGTVAVFKDLYNFNAITIKKV